MKTAPTERDRKTLQGKVLVDSVSDLPISSRPLSKDPGTIIKIFYELSFLLPRFLTNLIDRDKYETVVSSERRATAEASRYCATIRASPEAPFLPA